MPTSHTHTLHSLSTIIIHTSVQKVVSMPFGFLDMQSNSFQKSGILNHVQVGNVRYGWTRLIDDIFESLELGPPHTLTTPHTLSSNPPPTHTHTPTPPTHSYPPTHTLLPPPPHTHTPTPPTHTPTPPPHTPTLPPKAKCFTAA